MKKLLSLTLVLMLAFACVAFAADDGITGVSNPVADPKTEPYREGVDLRNPGGAVSPTPTVKPTPVPTVAGDGHVHEYTVTVGHSSYNDEYSKFDKQPADGTHLHTYTEETVLECPFCHAQQTYKSNYHDVQKCWDSNADGKCDACGAEMMSKNTEAPKTCYHLDIKVTDTWTEQHVKDIMGSVGHKVERTVHTIGTCKACGNNAVERVDTRVGYEVHNYNEFGECVVCGYKTTVKPTVQPTAKPGATATVAPTKAPSSGSTSGGSGTSSGSSDMPKTGSTGMAREAWIALSACCFIALCAVRKVRAK